MEIRWIVKCFAIIICLFAYNVKTTDVLNLDIQANQTIVMEIESTWSKWFRNTFINHRMVPRYMARFKQDNTFMFVISDEMFVLDRTAQIAAIIALQDPPYYTIDIDRYTRVLNPQLQIPSEPKYISLDDFERRFSENNYKSFISNPPQFDVSWVGRYVKTPVEVMERIHEVCFLQSLIKMLVWCGSSDEYDYYHYNHTFVNDAVYDLVMFSDSLNDFHIASDSDIDFYIMTSLTDEKIIKYNDIDGLVNSNFDPTLETVVVIHGFRIWPFSGTALNLLKEYKEAYFADETRRVNLIGIEWTGDMPVGYFRSTYRVTDIGRVVGDFLYEAIKRSLIRPKELHLIGHSLGAHVAGFIGKTLQARSHYGVRPALISALDPAGPWFNNIGCEKRVCVYDADRLDILYSNAGTLALNEDLGHATYYLNGGNGQPGCYFWNSACHHAYVNRFYRKMVVHQEAVKAWLCSDGPTMTREKTCHLPCNPRKFYGEYLLSSFGMFYVPYPAIDDSDISPNSVTSYKSMNVTENNRTAFKHTPMWTEKPKKIVILGANDRNVDFLAGLLTYMNNVSNMYIRHANGFNDLILPEDAHWVNEQGSLQRDKYIRNYGTQLNFNLNFLPMPLKFVLTVDYSDLFRGEFWTLLEFISGDKTYHSEVVFVAMNMPYFQGTLQYHVDQIKDIIQKTGLFDSIEIRGLHEIYRNANVSQIPNLQQELTDIRTIVDSNVEYSSRSFLRFGN